MILVTGGTGMLGAHLLFELVNTGNKVRALKRTKSNLDIVKRIFSYYSSNYEQLFTQIEWFDADILEVESIFQSMQGIDKVYHLAAMISFNPRDKEKMIQNNVKGTTNIINAALQNNIKKLCHVSSISALGIADNGIEINEETFRNPKSRYSGYSLSKFYSELEVWRGITEGLNAVIAAPSVILGPGDWNTGSPSIFSRIYKGLKYYTKGITGYVDVKDVTNAMIKLMESDISNERFILSADNLSYKDLFLKVAESLNVKSPVIEANAIMLGIAWRFEYIKSLLTSAYPLITKDMAYSALNMHLYSSKKIMEALDFKYTPIDKTIAEISQIYKNDLKEL